MKKMKSNYDPKFDKGLNKYNPQYSSTDKFYGKV